MSLFATSLFENAANLQLAVRKAEIVCFFGLGSLFEECFSQLVLAAGKTPDVLSDNAPHKWGKSFSAIPCISPQGLSEKREKILIIITIRNYESVYAQLVEMGFSNLFVACYERAQHRVGAIKQLAVRRGQIANADVKTISLQGKWALVTGATRGIGRHISIALAELGANIVVHGRALSHTEEVAQSCRSLGVEVRAVAADLGKPEELETLIQWLDRSELSIDILFNNAGISPSNDGGLWQMSTELFHVSYAVNLIAPVRLCQQLIPPMMKRGFGRVINVSSSIQKRPAEMAYACSKAALDKFVFDLQPELKGTGVMMSLLDPGWLRTDMGGEVAPHPVGSVLPGALLGAVIDGEVGGYWFSAQDYSGLSIMDAVEKAYFIGACAPN